jgi:AcrR family transcriptional regulator
LYHHFPDLPAFVSEFAEHWQAWLVKRFESIAAEPDLRRRSELIANRCFVAMTPGVQAMAAWSRTNPTIAEAMSAAHRGAVALSASTLAELAEDDQSGLVFGTMGITICVGIHHRPQALHPERCLRLVAMLFRSVGVDSDLIRASDRTRLRILPLKRVEPVGTSPTDIGNSSPAGDQTTQATRRAGRAGRNDTRTRYFTAAREILAEHGSAGLTIAGLVHRLELTKGSFRHHFDCLPNFVDQLAHEWTATELADIDACVAERNSRRRLERLLGDLLVEPDPADTAWRAWSAPIARCAMPFRASTATANEQLPAASTNCSRSPAGTARRADPGPDPGPAPLVPTAGPDNRRTGRDRMDAPHHGNGGRDHRRRRCPETAPAFGLTPRHLGPGTWRLPGRYPPYAGCPPEREPRQPWRSPRSTDSGSSSPTAAGRARWWCSRTDS